MLRIKEPKSIIDNKKYLIDFANLKQGLILNQKNFIDKKKLNIFFKNSCLGIPMLLPTNIKYFNYDKLIKRDIFKVSKKQIGEKIFITKKHNYGPLNNFFSNGNVFCSNATLKTRFKKYVDQIINFNSNLKDKIKSLKKKGKIIGAFQTRNIPHLGHEKIISKLLQECDYVFINPVIGVKKKGDARTIVLKKVYDYLIKKYYGSKVIFSPVYASMFYAGPREAIHHALIRQNLGFDKFVIGRDHAGSENIYDPLEAFKYAKKYQKKLKIKLLPLRGSYYCNRCKKVMISGECEKNLIYSVCKKNLKVISGTNFRKCLLKKEIFNFAREDLQNYIRSLKLQLFY